MPLKANLKKYLILGAVILAVAAYFFFNDGEEIRYVTEKVKQGSIEQIVSVNGTVESDAIINLKFQQAGQIQSLPVEEGDLAEKGAVLAELENDALEIEVQRANATVEIAQAELNLRNAGPTIEDVRISQAQIREAEINLSNSQSRLDDTKLANQENIRTAELEIKNSELALETSKKRLVNVQASGETTNVISSQVLRDAYDDTRINLLELENNTRGAILVADKFLGVDNNSINDDFEDFFPNEISLGVIIAENDYQKLKNDLNTFEQSFDAFLDLAPELEEPEKAIAYQEILMEAADILSDAEILLDTIYDFIDSILDTETTNQRAETTLASLQTEVDSELTAITSELLKVQRLIQTITNAQLDITSTGISTSTELDDALAAVSDAENNLEIAESNLEKVKVEATISENADVRDVEVNEVRLEKAEADHQKLVAKPRYVDIAALQAGVRQEIARRDRTVNDLEDTQIIAPVSGIITEVNVETGENVSTNDEILVMITDELQIKANIAETDITKIKVNDPVEITLDAFPLDRVFSGTVASVNPAETVIQGVIYYEAVIVFDQENDEIKSGMTANLEILTDSADETLIISSQGLQYEDDTAFVYILENDERVRRDIRIGLESDAEVEVLEGLELGEEVILYEE